MIKPKSQTSVILETSPTHPLQSKEWADFRRAWGNEVVETDDGVLTLHTIPLTHYKVGMFIKGPLPTQKMLTKLKTLAKEKNLLFIKLEPSTPAATYDVRTIELLTQNSQAKSTVNLLRKNGAVLGKTLFTPTTFWIDLQKSEEALLTSFSSKTRYNIRLALKKGVEVVEDNSNQAFDKYIELTRETVERQGFYSHSEKYHRLMWQKLHIDMVKNTKKPIARLLTASYKKQIITTWVVFVYKDFLYYPYGASTDKYKDVMANNLMLWEAIRYGKALNLTTFDLWGREEGKGFTKFKEGYNPQIVKFLGTWDLVTSPLYKLYPALESFRWLILRTKSKFAKPTF